MTKMLPLLLLSLLANFTANAQAFEERPNIVVIFIDDLGYTDLGCYGSTFYETPRVDALANQSVRFTQFYSAHPVCSPTRAALMTGKVPQRVGIIDWIPQPSTRHLPPEENTVGEALQASGYATGYIGKWHLGERDQEQPSSNGFEWQKCVNRGGQPGHYFFPFKRAPRKDRPAPRRPYWDVPDLEDAKEGDYLTDKLTDYAIEFIQKEREEPFFLCLAHYAVHTPIQSPPELVKKYRQKAMTLDDSPPPIEEKNGAKTRPRQDHPHYAAMMENLDINVGRLLDALEKQNIADNTVVIFTSDNGGLSTKNDRVAFTSVRPLRAGKGWCYEGGIRVPTFVRWPQKLEPSECKAPCITMDLYPTILEMAGLPLDPQQHLDGISLMNELTGKQTSDPEDQPRLLGWHYPIRHGSGHRPSTAIRVGDKKLLHFIDDDKYELYDLSTDLSEANDISTSVDATELKELKSKLSTWVDDITVR